MDYGIDLTSSASWDDEPTLVHPREVSEVPTRAVPLIPPPLPACLSRVHHELSADEQWLESLPAASRSVLEEARRLRSLDAPRSKFAVAQPI